MHVWIIRPTGIPFLTLRTIVFAGSNAEYLFNDAVSMAYHDIKDRIGPIEFKVLPSGSFVARIQFKPGDGETTGYCDEIVAVRHDAHLTAFSLESKR